jgi:hypothetical protein
MAGSKPANAPYAQVIDLIDSLAPCIPLGSPTLAPKLAPEVEIGRGSFGLGTVTDLIIRLSHPQPEFGSSPLMHHVTESAQQSRVARNAGTQARALEAILGLVHIRVWPPRQKCQELGFD